jgi:hypothetical protein
MSICALSSYGNDPAEWTNYFQGGGIDFPEMAEIAVLGTSLTTRTKNNNLITLTSENNKFCVHYGAANQETNDADVITIEEGKYSPNSLTVAMNEACQKNTFSPVLFNTVILNQNNELFLQLVGNQAFCQQFRGGTWKRAIGGINGTDAEYPEIVNGANSVLTMVPQGGQSKILYAYDTERLFVGDNNNNQTAVWSVSTNGNSDFEGLCGGVVFGNHNVTPNEYDPRVNAFVQDSMVGQPQKGNLNQFDLGWEIKNGQLNYYVFDNNAPVGAGGMSDRVKTVIGSVAFPAVAGVATKVVRLRYTFAGANIQDLQTQAVLEVSLDNVNFNQVGIAPLLKLYNKGGHFAVVGMPTNKNINQVSFQGAHHSDRQVINPQPNPNLVGANVTLAMSKLNLSVAGNLTQLSKKFSNVARTLGFEEGVPQTLTAARVALAVRPISFAITVPQTPLVIQFLDLGITGYLAGGSNETGGANQAPIVAISDSFTYDTRLGLGLSPKVWELSNKNWIKLQNSQAMNLNQFRVRITDLTGRKIDYLQGVSSIWFEIRASRTPAIKMPGNSCWKPKPCKDTNPNDWIKHLADPKQ